MLVPYKIFAKPLNELCINEILNTTYCIVSYQHFFYKNNFVGIMSTLLCTNTPVQFKADHNIAELKLHKKTVSILLI
jgi:hypothetical protein